MAVPWWFKRIIHCRFGASVAAWAFIAFWLAFERLHHGWDLQWPWFSIGNVFGSKPSWIQWYEYTGMLGGTLWVLLANLMLDRAVVAFSLVDGRVMFRKFALRAGVLIVLPLLFSYWIFHHYEQQGPTAEVVVVQPNIDPYTQKFTGDALQQLEEMLALAETVVTDGTSLIVMPETALQEGATIDMSTGAPMLKGLWENDLHQARSVQRMEAFRTRFPRVSLLSGMSSDSMFQPGSARPIGARPLFQDLPVDGSDPRQQWYMSYNAALFIPSHGEVTTYHKSKLVAGVEQMPFESLLGPLKAFSVDLGGTTGSLGGQDERAVLWDTWTGLAVAPAICYESVFGEHVAAHVRNGASLIAIMTNDGWWQNTPGYRQHLTFASIRAIETRRDVARSANTGTSCFADQRGELRDRTTWWVADARRSMVHMNTKLTFFVRQGDLIGRAAVVVSLILLIAVLVQALGRRKAQ